MTYKTRDGFTLIELIIVIILFVILTFVTVYVFRAVILSWSAEEKRAGIDVNIDTVLENISRELREATALASVNADELRFTTDANYIYYLYNAGDSYPPSFDQNSYELRKATLSGGINGSFTYGAGILYASDILPPPDSDLSILTNVATIDLKISRDDETIRSRTRVRPRNL